jgi:hypothetical protein
MNPLVFDDYSAVLCNEIGANYMVGSIFVRTDNVYVVEYVALDANATLIVDNGMVWLVDFEIHKRIPFSMSDLGKAFKLYNLLEIDRICGSEESREDLRSFAIRNGIPCIW